MPLRAMLVAYARDAECGSKKILHRVSAPTCIPAADNAFSWQKTTPCAAKEWALACKQGLFAMQNHLFCDVKEPCLQRGNALFRHQKAVFLGAQCGPLRFYFFYLPNCQHITPTILFCRFIKKTLADRFCRHSQAVKMVINFYKAWQNAVQAAQYAQAVTLRRTQLSDLAF